MLTFGFLSRLPGLPLAFLNLELFVVFVIMQIIALGAWWFRRSRTDRKLRDAIGRNNGRAIFRLLLRREFSNLSPRYASIMFFMGGFLLLTGNGLVQNVRAASLPTTAAISAPEVSALCSAADGPMPEIARPPIEGTIIRLISTALAQQLIQRTEHRARALIDPAYISNQRVSVQTVYGGTTNVLVPHGETIYVGETVSFIPAHLEPPDDCFYTPNLLTQ